MVDSPLVGRPAWPVLFKGCLVAVVLMVGAVIVFVAFFGFLMSGCTFKSCVLGSSKQNVNHDYAQSNRDEVKDLYLDLADQIDTHIQENYNRQDTGTYKNSPKESGRACSSNGWQFSITVGFYETISLEELERLTQHVATVMEPYGFTETETLRTKIDMYAVRLWNRDGQGNIDTDQRDTHLVVSITSPCYAFADYPTKTTTPTP